jgi:hypothetical protein
MIDDARQLELRLAVTTAEEFDELERALLKARASELSDVRRLSLRLTAGYGDATRREAMDVEARKAQLRYDLLSRLLDELRRYPHL